MRGITTNITLSKEEQQIARYLARSRFKDNRDAGVKMPYVGVDYTADKELDGIGAEMAFCKLCNLYPDLTSQIQSHSYDCLTHKDKRVDVKQSVHESARLIVPLTKKLSDADVYVLMIGRFPSYRFVGWAWANMVIRESNIDDSLPKPAYVLPPSELFRSHAKNMLKIK